MTHTYNITGMTCNGCIAKAKSQLLMLGDITEAAVQLEAPQATITMQKHIPLTVLQNALTKAGNYTITEAGDAMHHMAAPEKESSSWLSTYKHIILIAAYITGITLFIQASQDSFIWETWMRHFMSAFFITFSFFKLLNLKGFAESYSTYDIIARQWIHWGYIYAFIELSLGASYLLNLYPLLLNVVTFSVMSISLVGVVQSVLKKRKIQCACLGVVFNIPMSTVTIIEDALMCIMSAFMILKTI
jgi:cation transport ATPase